MTEAAESRRRTDPRRHGPALATRLLLFSALLALVVAGAFAVLLLAVSSLREATQREKRAKDVIAASLLLEKLVLDLETGVSGLAITANPRFLRPWENARAELPGRLASFERLAVDPPAQRRRARLIVRLIRDYVNDYSLPLVAIASENPRAARAPVAQSEGRRRVEAIRADFARFRAEENDISGTSAQSADDRSRRAIALAVSGLVASAALIVLFGAYLARSIARPVREVAGGASRLAGGDLSLRLAETGPGEVGELTESFNAMAEALERSRNELEEQYERVRQSEQLKSELVSIVSHEVRTPLASVLGFTSLLLQRDVDAETRRRYLGIIDAQGKRLASLLDDFLDVQRIEEGRLALSQELVDMATLLREQAELFMAQSARHTLEVSLREKPLLVRGDPNRLAQAVGNLLSNAIKYSPDGGTVEIVGEREDGAVRVSVRDEGLGIAEEQQAQIFTKFFRGDAAASGIGGTGLGLAFARAVVEAHGGRMSFTSSAGKGSTFWLELPTARKG